jgi:hypothetical protein
MSSAGIDTTANSNGSLTVAGAVTSTAATGLSVSTTPASVAAGDTVTFTANAAHGGAVTSFTFGSGAGQVALGSNSASAMTNLATAMQSAGISASVDNQGVVTVSGGTAAYTGATTTNLTEAAGGFSNNDTILVGTQNYKFAAAGGGAPNTTYLGVTSGSVATDLATFAAALKTAGVTASVNTAGNVLSVSGPAMSVVTGANSTASYAVTQQTTTPTAINTGDKVVLNGTTYNFAIASATNIASSTNVYMGGLLEIWRPI